MALKIDSYMDQHGVYISMHLTREQAFSLITKLAQLVGSQGLANPIPAIEETYHGVSTRPDQPGFLQITLDR